jgi:hypothetical protein
MSGSVPRSNGSSACPRYMSDQIYKNFCVKFVNSTCGTLVVLMLACGEYAVKKWAALHGTGGPRKGEKMCKMTRAVGTEEREGHAQVGTEHEPGALRAKVRCHGSLLGVNLHSGLTGGFSTVTMPLCTMRQ